jgi:signal transduction histidine kinase
MTESRITEQRGWDVGVAASSIVFAIILLIAEPAALYRAVGLGALGGFALSWFAFGRRHQSSSPSGLAMVAVILLVTPFAVWAQPSLAIMQCITYPLIWTVIDSTKWSIVANVVHAAGIGVGLFLTTGADGEALLQAVGIEGISVSFSIVIGLWITSIAVRSHERQRLLDELRAAQDQLAGLSREAGITSERERLAREIHDTIAQDLTGLVLLAQRARRELDGGTSPAESLTMLEDAARTALAETRALVAASSPPALEHGGIAAALERLGERFARETTITVDVDAVAADVVDRDLEVVLLRCAQEGLSNIRKHSGAARATVRLRFDADERSLRITDDGSGFSLADERAGFGLAGMRDRIALVGGTLDIESSEVGTSLLITLPRGTE